MSSKESLQQALAKIKSAHGLTEALHAVVREVRSTLKADVCTLFLVDFTQDEWVLWAEDGLSSKMVGQVRLDLDEDVVGLIGRQDQPLHVDDQQVNVLSSSTNQGGALHALLGMRIKYGRQLVGVIIVQKQEKSRFEEDQVGFLMTLCTQIAPIIVNMQADETLKKGDRSLILTGIPASPGVAIGKVVTIYPPANLDAVPDRKVSNVDKEIQEFQSALQLTKEEIQNLIDRLSDKLSSEEQTLFHSYIQILSSPTFYKEVVSVIATGQWAQGALRCVVKQHIAEFEAMEDPYLRERGTDVKDLGCRVLFYLQSANKRSTLQYPKRTILAGEALSATSLVEVPEDRLVGVICASGSSNSHLAILARALGVPTIMGVSRMPVHQIDARAVIIDGYYGQIYVSPPPRVYQEFLILLEEEKAFTKSLEDLRDSPSKTLDGHHLPLYVNTGLAVDIHRALSVGAEGVGLNRTEIPFMVRDRLPTEEEQRIIYRQILKAFSPRKVVMRSLDIGGDKILPYFPIEERNPFLGWRGIRISLDYPQIFLTQIRAILRAGEGLNNVSIMLPMISHISELDEALNLIRLAYQDVVQEVDTLQMPSVGIMIEIPSAVYQIDALAQRVDFLSVGSNDLIQYMLAVDRNNARVAHLYNSLHPSVLQALQAVVEGGHRAKKHVSICGEMAGDPIAVIVLLAMGFDSLSLSAVHLPRIKWVIRNFSMEKSKLLLSEIMKIDDPQVIHRLLVQALDEEGLGGLMRAGRS